MAQIDPTKIKIESHAVPVWETEVTFQEIMAEQMRHAPWLMLSAVIHVIIIALLYVLIPAEQRKDSDISANIDLKQQEKVEEPPPPPPPPPKEEKVKEPVIQDNQVQEVENVNNFETFDTTTKESAFDSNQWNSAVGLGGGAGGRYGGRGGGRGGGAPGGKATAQAIEAALQWLKDHQDEDGKWDCDGFMKHDDAQKGDKCTMPGNPVHDVGVTGLALLAFLGDGSTLRAGPYKENIKEGVKWLREQQQDSGLFGGAASNDFVYDHAIAAYAMCEAYGLSQYTSLKKYAQNGINYLESHRNPYSVWRYQPRDNDNDTSVTGWCIMAYESGRFFGLDVNKNALQLCITWLDQVTDQTGKCGYTKMSEPSSRHPGDHGTRFPAEKGEALTAVGLFCRFFLDQNPKEVPVMNAAADLLLKKPPVWDAKTGVIDHYYWYYATYALYQMGGRHWSEWSKKLVDAVVKQQRNDGNFKGSWDAIGVWGEDGGRVYSTAILALTLEAYYRYTRLVR